MITLLDIKQNIQNVFSFYGMNPNGLLTREVIDCLTDSMNALVIREHENLKHSFALIRDYDEHLAEIQKLINTFQLKQKLTR